MRVPEDLSITGFGAMPELGGPLRIPSVDPHPEELGVRAAAGLIDRIEGRADGLMAELVAMELAPGATVARIVDRKP